MLYHIKPEYLAVWGEDATTDTIITEQELNDICRGWECDPSEVKHQLLTIPGMNLCVTSSNTRFGSRFPVCTSSAMKVANEIGRWEYGETFTIYSPTGKALSKVIWSPTGYYRVNT